MIFKEYGEEELQTDMDWLQGYGMTESEARKFIFYLLRHRWEGDKKIDDDN